MSVMRGLAAACVALLLCAATAALLAGCDGSRGDDGSDLPPLPAGPVARTHTDGSFYVEFDEPTRARPGAGVICLLPVDDAGPSAPWGDRLTGTSTAYVGRAELNRDEPITLLTRVADQPWTEVECSTERDANAPRQLRDTLTAWSGKADDHVPGLAGFLRHLGHAAAADGPSPPAVAIPAPVGAADAPRTVPEEGASLAAWAPDDCIYVRFRSVESAYRVVHQLDAILGRVLAVEGDAREFGVSELTLHDLLLPTIWRTNPSAERGVGELALLLAPPLRRGRLRAALVMRVVDPELHYMQTEAGLHQESQPDHLWRPEDDPFPELRDRRNFRERLLDVEVVATDGSLLEHVLTASSRVADDEEYRARRAEHTADGRRPRSEAAFAFVTDRARDHFAPLARLGASQVRRRLSDGLSELVHRWTGLARPRGRVGTLGVHEKVAIPDWWRGGRIDYGVEGSAVELWFSDAVMADAARTRLLPPADEEELLARACLTSLTDLLPLTLVEPRQRLVQERAFTVLGWRPVCPCGGRHDVDATTGIVSCSVHGRPGRARNAEAPAWPVEDVGGEGTTVTLRVPRRVGVGR